MKLPAASEHVHVVHPAEVYVGQPPEAIRTVLGSCVAISLWDQKSGIGGLCHFLLPEKDPQDDQWILNGRYAEDALLILLERMKLKGVPRGKFQVKLMGGGSMLNARAPDAQQSRVSIGKKNVAKGLSLLQQYHLSLSASHCGGKGHRHIELDTKTGVVSIYHSETDVIVSI